tara:strand:+ start:417 stop:932 length:516 start_codon:yes stop_codon:yes gene_type:complete
MDLHKYIRDVPDFPIEGIIFKDITPLLSDINAFQEAINKIINNYNFAEIDVVAGVESRGFLFAAPIADRMKKPLVLFRKSGKLPYKTKSASYDLEYGSSTIEIHEDAINENDRILLIDDLIATGGTLGACLDLVDQFNAKVCGIAVIIELSFLNGRDLLKNVDIFSIIKYQ